MDRHILYYDKALLGNRADLGHEYWFLMQMHVTFSIRKRRKFIFITGVRCLHSYYQI